MVGKVWMSGGEMVDEWWGKRKGWMSDGERVDEW